MPKSYYEILDVDPKASEDVIRRAYRKKIREFHPDLNPEKARSHTRSRQLNTAVEVLTDSRKRKQYDEKLLRMGKSKANAEFDFSKDVPEYEFEAAGEPKANEQFKKRKETKEKTQSRSTRQQTEDREPDPRTKTSKQNVSFWIPVSIASTLVSVGCVSLLCLWAFFKLDPTGLMATTPTTQVNRQPTSSDQNLNLRYEKAKSQLSKTESQLKGKIEQLEQVADKYREAKKENDRLIAGLQKQKGKNPFSKLDPELLALMKGWLVEYRYSQQLFEDTQWKHHWWHVSHIADWFGNNKPTPIRMRPVVWHTGHIYVFSEAEQKQWVGLFIPEMRPVAIFPTGNVAEPNREKIEKEVEELFRQSQR